MALAPVTETMRPIETVDLWPEAPVAPRDGLVSMFLVHLEWTAAAGAELSVAAMHVRDVQRDGRSPRTSVPSDLALRISSLPPCSCTSALAIGRPRPVPSRQRERPASTWANGVSATAISSLVMPRPVSRMRTRDAAIGKRARLDVTEPPAG